MATDDDSGDLDRTAILARRQRFIALALSSLAATCGDDNGTSSGPMPCLDVAPQTESATASTTDPTATATEGMTSTTTGMPMPCLDVSPETSGDESGPSESTTSSGTDGGTGADSGSDSTGRPQPCLAPKG